MTPPAPIRRSRFLKSLSAAAIAFWAGVSLAADAGEKEAVATAEKWLAVVDGGDAAGSWDAAAAYFRNAVAKGDWERSVKAVREPLGKLVSRKLKSASHRTTLPGAPDGEYVVIQFAAEFENKKSAVETVTPMKEKDGTWRVSGYFVK
jgi:hypothetical protein